MFINTFETHSKNYYSKRWWTSEFMDFYRQISNLRCTRSRGSLFLSCYLYTRDSLGIFQFLLAVDRENYADRCHSSTGRFSSVKIFDGSFLFCLAYLWTERSEQEYMYVDVACISGDGANFRCWCCCWWTTKTDIYRYNQKRCEYCFSFRYADKWKLFFSRR